MIIMENSDKVKKSLDYSNKDAYACSVMGGAGETYISPFAIQMGANNTQVGLLTAVANLVAPIFQLGAIKSLRHGVERKRIVTKAVFLQAAMFLPLMLIPFIFKSNQAVAYVILFFALYSIFGGYGGPAWGSWMGDLVPSNERGKYFGRRNKIAGFIALMSTFVAGFVLDFFKSKIYLGFVIIFSVSMVGRYISWYFLKRMYEPKLIIKEENYFSLFKFVKKANSNNFGRFVFYIAFLNFAVNIAGPFFAVYMLRDLGFSYTQFMIATVTASITSLFSMTFWGKIGDKYGNVRVMKVTDWGIGFIPVFWIFATNIYHVILIQAFSGFVWAGMNLTHFNFIYDAVTQQKRAICMSYLNILRGICVFVGAILGGIISSKYTLFGSGLFLIFLLSGFFRLLNSLIYLNSLKEVREVEKGRPMLNLVMESWKGFVGKAIHTIYIGSTSERKKRWKKWKK